MQGRWRGLPSDARAGSGPRAGWSCTKADPLAHIPGSGVTWLIVLVFAAVYLGMALGRWPLTRIDRTGIAVLGAIVLHGAGAVTGDEALAAIDFPTLVLLFGLMVLSAQFSACGFYDWCSARIAAAPVRPVVLLGLTVLVSGVLSAILANDVVVFAMTPMLCVGLLRRGLDPRPFLIALTAAANAGSAATVIGNPQNILIGEVGHLSFFPFLAVCGPPALIAMLIVHLVVAWQWRAGLRETAVPVPAADQPIPAPRRGALVKAVLAVAALLALFATPLPHATSAMLVAGALLASREMATREMLGLVDWHLLVLFAGLFVVTAALGSTGLTAIAADALAGLGMPLDNPLVMLPVTLVGSNTIGNVPLVILLLQVMPKLDPVTLHALAVLSTLAGNLLIVGSLANIITVERAREAGVSLGFVEHARSGIPITLLSMAAALAWLRYAL